MTNKSHHMLYCLQECSNIIRQAHMNKQHTLFHAGMCAVQRCVCPPAHTNTHH
uniref:Uncharacterized protein n=1 Tax=Rhizophora mucronata TaxID=61149 RepID=A0A2P2NPJ7_RHIMU